MVGGSLKYFVAPESRVNVGLVTASPSGPPAAATGVMFLVVTPLFLAQMMVLSSLVTIIPLATSHATSVGATPTPPEGAWTTVIAVRGMVQFLRFGSARSVLRRGRWVCQPCASSADAGRRRRNSLTSVA